MNNRTSAVIFAADGGMEIASKYPKAMAEVLYQPLAMWAVQWCRQAGIQMTVMVCGHSEKAMAVAQSAGVRVAETMQQAAEAVKESEQVFALGADLFFVDAAVISRAGLLHQKTGCAVTKIAAPGGRAAAAWLTREAFTQAAQGNMPQSGESYWEEGKLLPFATRKDLREIERQANEQQIERLWAAGVNMSCTDGIVISPMAQVGRDTTLYPGTQLKGDVTIGEDCRIGPNTVIENSTVGDGTVIHSSFIESSRIGKGGRIGPNSHLRPQSVLADKVKIGNFVEVKNSVIGEGSSVAHLTYIGDTDMGAYVNVGCGCVCVNYDGYSKYRTTIEDDAFVGCNTNLVAPVTVKKGAFIAAGSTICSDVPEDALAVARARQVNKEGWAAKHREEGIIKREERKRREQQEQENKEHRNAK